MDAPSQHFTPAVWAAGTTQRGAGTEGARLSVTPRFCSLPHTHSPCQAIPQETEAKLAGKFVRPQCRVRPCKPSPALVCRLTRARSCPWLIPHLSSPCRPNPSVCLMPALPLSCPGYTRVWCQGQEGAKPSIKWLMPPGEHFDALHPHGAASEVTNPKIYFIILSAKSIKSLNFTRSNCRSEETEL